MKEIIVHRDAEDELAHAVEYYEERCSGLGLDFLHSVKLAFIAIQQAPALWPIGRHGTRSSMLKRFPYLIHYFELEDAIWIVAIAHMKRKPFYWKKRAIKKRRTK